MVFLQCFGAFSVPLIAGGNYQVLAVKIFAVATVFLDWPLASAMAVVMGSCRSCWSSPTDGGMRRRVGSMRRVVRRILLRGLLLTCFVLFITLPLVMVLLEAFGADWFGVRCCPPPGHCAGSSGPRQTVDLGRCCQYH